MYAFGLGWSGWSVVVVCSRDDTGALRLKTTASPIFSLTIRLIWVELRGFEPLTPSLRTRCSTPCRPGQTPENPCGIDDLGSRRSSSFCVVFDAHVVAMWSRANVTDRKRESLEQRCRLSLLAFHCTSTLCTRNDAGSRSSCGG